MNADQNGNVRLWHFANMDFALHMSAFDPIRHREIENNRSGTGSALSPLISSLYSALSICRRASATFFRRKTQADRQHPESTFQLI